MSMRWSLLPVMAFFIVCAETASAQTASIDQKLFEPTGNPSLVANSSPDGNKGRVRWSICPPNGGPCAKGASDAFLDAGEQAPGTTFEAAVDYRGKRTVDRSPPWGGRVTAQAPPVLLGQPVVGSRVRATAGRWTGGWGDETDDLRIQACRTATASRCEVLSAPALFGGSADASATVPGRYLGWYLFAVNVRAAAEEASTAIGYTRPRDAPPAAPGQTVAFSAAGLVTGAAAELRRKAGYRNGKPLLGLVRCFSPCRAAVVVVAGGTSYELTLTVRRRARIAPRLRRAPPGPWRVIVRIAGRRVAAATIDVRR